MVLLQVFEGAYILLAVGGLLFLLLVGVFVYLLARRHQDRIVDLLEHEVVASADRWFRRRTPRAWSFIRNRFSSAHWHGLELTLGVGLVFLAVFGFLEIAESWIDEELLLNIDRQVNQGLAAIVTEDLITVMYTITQLGDFIVMLGIGVCVAGVLYWRGYLWYGGSLIATMVSGGIVLLGLKAIFGRARPVEQAVQVAGESFPSGHAFNSIVFYGYLIFLTWLLVDRDLIRVFVTVVLSLLIFLIGLSRIYLGVHWVSDVVGGFTVGLAWLVGSLILTRALLMYRRGAPSDR